MKNHKRKEKKIDDKFTNYATRKTNLPFTDTPIFSSQDAGSIDSNYPYPLINCKFVPYSTTAIKNQKKKENKIDDKDIFDTPLHPIRPDLIPQILPPKMMAQQTTIFHIYWEIVINISKLPPTPK